MADVDTLILSVAKARCAPYWPLFFVLITALSLLNLNLGARGRRRFLVPCVLFGSAHAFVLRAREPNLRAAPRERRGSIVMEIYGQVRRYARARGGCGAATAGGGARAVPGSRGVRAVRAGDADPRRAAQTRWALARAADRVALTPRG